jgi:L-alanine-DL-glutamate epimerase-like enolase superfamily enzyme
MKIIGVEIFPLTVSYEVIEESFGAVGKRENDVVIKVYTDEGITGLGEGSTLGPFYSGESQETVMGIIGHYLFPNVLEGEDPFNLDRIHWKMDKVVYGNTVAKSAVDFSLHDIIGKSLGIPVYKLLGGAASRKVSVRWTVGIDTPEIMAEQARKSAREGYCGIKMKVGLEPKKDIERVAAVRDAIGPQYPIDVDVNGAYLPKEAIHTLKQMEEFGPLLIEQPVNRDDLEGMALVRRSVNIPIGACESALTLPQIQRIIRMEAADFFNYKVDRSGGLFRGKQAVYMIDAAGLFAVASEQLCFGIGVAAQAHFAVSTSVWKTPLGIGAGILRIARKSSTRDMKEDIVFNTPLIENGYLHVPDGAGLGVELNDEAVNRYLSPGKEPVLLGNRS